MIKAVTVTNDGIIDVESDMMIGTHPQTLRESQLFQDNFNHLMHTFQEYGYIPYDDFDGSLCFQMASESKTDSYLILSENDILANKHIHFYIYNLSLNLSCF